MYVLKTYHSFDIKFDGGAQRTVHIDAVKVPDVDMAMKEATHIALVESNLNSPVKTVTVNKYNENSFIKELDFIELMLTGEQVLPSMTMYLIHGRDDPSEEMDDWGFGMPPLHNIEQFNNTYTAHVSLSIVTDKSHEVGMGPLFTALVWDEDMLRLILRKETADRLGLGGVGQETEPYGIKCRVFWFGDWSLKLEV